MTATSSLWLSLTFSGAIRFADRTGKVEFPLKLSHLELSFDQRFDWNLINHAEQIISLCSLSQLQELSYFTFRNASSHSNIWYTTEVRENIEIICYSILEAANHSLMSRSKTAMETESNWHRLFQLDHTFSVNLSRIESGISR